jgi:hypothetical protein
MAVACVALGLLAASAWSGGAAAGPPPARVDRSHAVAAVRSERYFAVDGHPAGPGFAPLSRFWRAADGWVRTHANYPWHKAALLRALAVADEPTLVEAAVRRLPAQAVEEGVFEAGGVAAAVRPVGVWRAHPQGVAVASEPLIGHAQIGDAAPRRPRGGGRLPATGVKVLDLTRVIAGPVCTRFLGALGADVLRVDPPGLPDMRPGTFADSLLAKRSAVVDLASPAQVATLHALLDRADVLVCGYRPGSLARFSLGADEIADRHDGLVVVYLSAWGHTGPWAERRGFDSVVQAATGIAATEGDADGSPGALPCQLLDHGTGYLAAAAALDGLRRQAATGGTHVRLVSLARTAAWLTSARADPAAGGPGGAPEPASTWLADVSAPEVPIEAVAPPGSLDGRALRWPGPPARYQHDRPQWEP